MKTFLKVSMMALFIAATTSCSDSSETAGSTETVEQNTILEAEAESLDTLQNVQEQGVVDSTSQVEAPVAQ